MLNSKYAPEQHDSIKKRFDIFTTLKSPDTSTTGCPNLLIPYL